MDDSVESAWSRGIAFSAGPLQRFTKEVASRPTGNGAWLLTLGDGENAVTHKEST